MVQQRVRLGAWGEATGPKAITKLTVPQLSNYILVVRPVVLFSMTSGDGAGLYFQRLVDFKCWSRWIEPGLRYRISTGC